MTPPKIPKIDFLLQGSGVKGSESQNTWEEVPRRIKASGKFWAKTELLVWLWWFLEVSVNEWPSAIKTLVKKKIN